MGLKESGLRGSLRNVSVGIDAIPDSDMLHAHYDATELNFSDGDTVSTFEDQTDNDHELTASGGPTYISDGINGNPSVFYDGVDDKHIIDSWENQPTPNHVFVVFNHQGGESERVFGNGSGDNAFGHQYRNDNGDGGQQLFNGESLNGGDSTLGGTHITTCYFDDGGESYIRTDGSLEVSGDAGTRDSEGFSLGVDKGEIGFWEGEIGEVLWYQTGLDSESEAQAEEYLSDKWGISI